MPKYEGVYEDGRGGWYFKANFGRDPLTGKKHQRTKRREKRVRELSGRSGS